jgi:hypothetical protein
MAGFREDEFLERLGEATASFDRDAASRLANELIAALDQGETLSTASARRILQELRRKRFFDLMERLAEALRQFGHDEAIIRRLYAQALIDQGRAPAAIDVLEALIARTAEDPAENAEARGLLGRVYKQRYVDAVNAEPQAAARRGCQLDLRRSLAAYHEIYRADRLEHHWHGINAAALVARARRDGVPLDDAPDDGELAREILAGIEARGPRQQLDHWRVATAAEACVALGRPADALLWIAEYVQRQTADAFELSSTLRQLTEVWRLEIGSPPGSLLLPLLQSHLLQRQGGRVELASGAIGETRGRTAAVAAAATAAADSGAGAAAAGLEKVLGQDGVVTLTWYRTGLDRCRLVAQVQTRMGEGIGTGFLVRGSDFWPALDGLLLLTNAHVVSDDPAVQDRFGSLPSAEAWIRFEALQPDGGSRCRAAMLLWSSPPAELDATLLALDPPPAADDFYPIASRLPPLDGPQKVYVIGHPGGRSLSLSLQDNLLLDHDGERLLHYRAPTEGGSSGSPVFNQQWDLIGLHHAGSMQMRRLKGVAGTWPANEGIWIQRIIAEIRAAAQRQ